MKMGKVKMSNTRGFKSNGTSTIQGAEPADEGSSNKSKASEIGKIGLNLGTELANAGSDTEKADATYNAAVDVTTAVVPVVGGLIKAGDQIGAPLKKMFEKADSKGQVNETKAKTGHILGTLFNPAKTLSQTMFDKEKSAGEKTIAAITGGISQVFKGNDYVNKLEKDNQKALGIYKDKSPVVTNKPSEYTKKIAKSVTKYNLGRMKDKKNQDIV